jgi:hypothetical protein
MEPQLWAEIQSALGGLSANLSSTAAGADLYEAYVWSLVLEAAQNEGATIRLQDRHGSLPTNFWFRTSPSSIFSSAHNYCHAEISFPNCPVLEAHVGIYIAGRSQVAHECDVAVVYQNEAQTCRAQNVHPRSGKALLTVECKYYIDSSIGIGLGRAFLGLLHDIYNGDRFFVGTRRSNSVGKLFSKHKKQYELGLSPLDTRLEGRLRSAFERVFRDFQHAAA